MRSSRPGSGLSGPDLSAPGSHPDQGPYSKTGALPKHDVAFQRASCVCTKAFAVWLASLVVHWSSKATRCHAGITHQPKAEAHIPVQWSALRWLGGPTSPKELLVAPIVLSSGKSSERRLLTLDTGCQPNCKFAYQRDNSIWYQSDLNKTKPLFLCNLVWTTKANYCNSNRALRFSC